jgi:uncharacterized protein (TIGR00369 family)
MASIPTFEPEHPDYHDAVTESFARQGLMRAFGVELIRVEPGLCELRAPFSERLAQQHGYFHGAIVGAVLDSAGGYAALSLQPPGSEVLTTEFKLNFLEPADGEDLIARGTVLKPGGRLIVTESKAYCLKAGVASLCAVMLQSIVPVHAP